MGIANEPDGDPSLAAALFVFAKIVGVVMVTPLMNAFGIRDYAARGCAAGVAAHGIGTARAIQVDDIASNFAGVRWR